MEPGVRRYMESWFDHDFSAMCVCTRARAREAARVVNARAFTRAPHIVFNAGEYQPGTASGRQLLAHELTQVVQQERVAMPTRSDRVIVDDARSSAEQEARAAAIAVVGSRPAAPIRSRFGSGAALVVQREPASGASEAASDPLTRHKLRDAQDQCRKRKNVKVEVGPTATVPCWQAATECTHQPHRGASI